MNIYLEWFKFWIRSLDVYDEAEKYIIFSAENAKNNYMKVAAAALIALGED